MLTRFFKHIRRKPKSVRTRYAFGFATTFTAIIAVFWFSNSSVFEFSSNEIVKDKTESTPFSTIIKQAKEQWANVQGSDNSEQKEDENTAENTETQNSEPENEIQNRSYPTEIKLSEKDLEQIKEKENSAKSTSTSNSSQQVYREVMIATSSEKIGTEDSEDRASETNTSTNQ